MDFNDKQVCPESPEGTPCGHHACRCVLCSCGLSSACSSPKMRGPRASSTETQAGLGRLSSPRRVLLKCFSVAVLAASLGGVGAAGVEAQVGGRAHRTLSVSFTQTRPVGELGANIGSGYGVVGAFLLPFDRDGMLSLRLEVGAAEYGHETKRTAFSESVGGRVEVNVRTTNSVVPGSVGLQLAAPSGLIRPYVNSGLGVVAFYTDSRVEPTSGGEPLASMVNQWDAALAWTVGGGLYVPLTKGPRNVLLDISVQYVRGGRAQYLAPGSIVDLPDGRVTITPMESGARILALRLGASFGL